MHVALRIFSGGTRIGTGGGTTGAPCLFLAKKKNEVDERSLRVAIFR